MQSAGSIAAQHEDNRPGRGSSYWLNLAAAGLLLFYALYIAWQLIMRMMCSQKATGAGMLATLALLLLAWRQRIGPDTSALPVAVAGVLAASTALAWHSHIHMAVVLIPPLLYLYQAGLIPQRLFNHWIFAPALIFVAMVLISEALIALRLASADIQPWIYFILGAGRLSANLCLFVWAVRRAAQPVSATRAAV